MKQSILKKSTNFLDENYSKPFSISETSASYTSLNFDQKIPRLQQQQTSKIVRFIEDLKNENSNEFRRSSPKLTRPKTNQPEYKKLSIFSSKTNESSSPFNKLTKQNQNLAYNLSYNIYKREPTKEIKKGLRITSATIESRITKSTTPYNRSTNESSKSISNTTPVRTPVVISNTTLSNTTKSANILHEKKSSTNYYYYFNRLNQSANQKNLSIRESFIKTQNTPTLSPIKLNQTKFNFKLENNHNGSNDSINSFKTSIDLSSSFSSSNQNLIIENKNQKIINIDSSTENLKAKNFPSSLTLYTYLLQNNKGFTKEYRASVIRSETKKLSIERESSNINLKFRNVNHPNNIISNENKSEFNNDDKNDSLTKQPGIDKLEKIFNSNSNLNFNQSISNKINENNFQIINET